MSVLTSSERTSLAPAVSTRSLPKGSPRRLKFGTIVRHVVPNSIGPALVQASVLCGFALQIEAALSFLGLGVQPPTASWGLMVSTGRDVLLVAPHVATVPGLAIMVAVLAFNLVGDGLRDALDPRAKVRIEH